MSTVHGGIHTSIVCVYEFRRGFCTSVLSFSSVEQYIQSTLTTLHSCQVCMFCYTSLGNNNTHILKMHMSVYTHLTEELVGDGLVADAVGHQRSLEESLRESSGWFFTRALMVWKQNLNICSHFL